MPIIEIDGVGKVEVDDTFTKASPEDQGRIVEEIAAQLKGSKPSQVASAGPNAPQVKTNPNQPKTGLTDAIGAGWDNAQATFGRGVQVLGDYFNQPEVAQWGKQVDQNNTAEAAADNYQRPADVAPSVAEGFRKDGLTGAGKAALYGAAENAAPLAVAGGSTVAATAGGPVALGVAGLGALAGGVLSAGSISKEKEAKGLDPKMTGLDLGVAVANGAMNLIGAKGGGYMLQMAKGVGTDVMTGVLGDLLQMGAIQTEGGVYLPQEVGDRILESAVQAGIGSGAVHGAKAVKDAPGAAAGAIKGSFDRAQVRDAYQNNPDQVASDLRVTKLYEDRLQTIRNQGNGESQQPASVVFKSVMDDLDANLRATADALFPSSHHSPDERNSILKDAISKAKRHNRELGSEGEDVGYFDTELDRVRDLKGVDDATKETLLNGLRDLNTAAANSLKMRMRGPGEIWGQRLGGAALSTVGHMAVPGLGLAAGVVGPAVGKAIGRRVDSFLGTQSPDVLRRAEARKQVADKLGIQPGDTVQSIKGVLQAAQTRAAARKAQVQADEAKFQKSRLDLRSKDIVPPGGIDQVVHQYTGLKPLEVDKGLAELVNRGVITQADVDAFINKPKSLMKGNKGLMIQNELTGLIHEGVLKRDPQWAGPGVPGGMPPGASGSPAGASNPGSTIHNPISYQATVEQAQRVLSHVLGASNDPGFRKAAVDIATAKSKPAKRKVMEDYLKTQPAAVQALYKTLMEPLTNYGTN